MGVNITLRRIMDEWNPAKGKKDYRAFLLSVFPDCYSYEVCQDNTFIFEDIEIDDIDRQNSLRGKTPRYKGMGNSTISALFRGNRLTLRGKKEPSPKFTEHFICGLADNPKLSFRHAEAHAADESRSHFRGNMFEKILAAVKEKGTPSSGEHPLFVRTDFLDVWEGTPDIIAQEFLKVGEAVALLLENPTKSRISYAIFLLIVTSVVQDRIGEVDFLYKPENLERVYEYESGEKLIETASQKHGPFYDRYYFDHDYHVYMFREASGKLWEKCTLRMERMPNGRPVATLEFKDGISSPVSGNGAIERTYTGTPMYSPADKMIFIAMADEKHTFLLLSMPYREFKFAPMYFRTCFMTKASPDLGIPKTHKAAVTAKPVPSTDIPYIEGLLKIDNDQLYLSDRQKELFLKKFEDYSWMKDFKENYLPLFEVHRKKSGLYHFNSDEILSCSMSNLCQSDRLRILLALKSVDASNNPDLYKYVLCEVPKGTHHIFKYDAEADPAPGQE